MAKIHVIGHRRRLDDTLAALQELGAVHLIDVTQDSTVRLPPLTVDEAHLQEIEDARYLSARLQSLLALVSPPMPVDPDTGFDLGRVRASVDAAAPEIEQLARRLDELHHEQDTLPRHLDSLKRLLPLVPELQQMENYDTMAVVLDARHAGILGELNQRLNETLGGNFEIISDRVDTDTVGAIIVFPNRSRGDVESMVGREQVSRLRLPHEYETVPFRQAITEMESRLRSIETEIQDTHNRIEDLVRPHMEWPGAVSALEARQDQLSAIRKLGATPHTFVVSGWLPERSVEMLRRTIAERVGADIMVEVIPRSKDETPPVALENSPVVAPFQPLVRLLALPAYGTFDPTSLMTLFLPLFFGMMVGDVAYGVIIGATAWIVSRRHTSPTVKDFARVFLHSAAWTIVWGFLYGEFFGDLGRRWFGLEPLWIDREAALQPLLLFALAIGGGHVLLGLVLGIWQARRSNDRHTLTERVAHLIALIGLFAVAGVMADLLPEGAMTPAIAAIVVGLVLLVVLGGKMGALLGPIELMGTIGNVLSYLRLAAIGLASVYLARVANELGATGPLWLGIIVAALFHALNLILGVFSPTIQALRLHYVEFFQKFFTEGGEPYEPFGGGDHPIEPGPAMTGPPREE
jgi:V/A-type H+-transporting ATPase subunit I